MKERGIRAEQIVKFHSSLSTQTNFTSRIRKVNKHAHTHCYWSRANLGPVWYGDMENLRWIQENLDWHQHGIFAHILWNTHRSIIFHVWLGKIMFEQLGYSLQKSEDILTGHQYFSPFSTQLFHLGLSVVCSIQDAKITHIKCEIFMYRNVEFHGISHSILTH